MKRLIRLLSISLIPILIISSTLVFIISAQAKNPSLAPLPTTLKLPSGQVNASYTPYLQTTDASFHITLTGVGSGFDVQDNTIYLGFCLEDHSYPNGSPVTLYSTYDPNMPLDMRTYQSADIPLVQQGLVNIGDPVPWAELNWAFNNQGTATPRDIQNVVHLIVWGTATSTGSLSQTAIDLAAAAKSHNDFVPKAGQIIGVILYRDGLGIANRGFQDTIIEVTMPSLPSVSLVKMTNGQTASNPNGSGVPQIKPGDPVTWTYALTNTGNTSIAKSDVVVADNEPGVTPVFDVELSGNGDAFFDPGEVWQYKAIGTGINLLVPPAGTITQVNACTLNGTQPPRTAYINTGTVTIPGATTSAQSSYCNPPNPSISLVKKTNGQIAGDPNGADVPQIKPGDPVTWTYLLTNTGNVPIAKSAVVVSDNQNGVTPVFDVEISGNGDATFDPGEVWQYKATGIAFNLLTPPAGTITQVNACTVSGTQPARTAYINTGTATIPGANSSATSSYCNPLPSISIIKYTNGKTATDPNGTDVPQIRPGESVVWTYKVTNTGSVSIPKASVVVTDNQPGVSPAFDQELTGNGDVSFDPGEVWQYKASGSALDLTLAPPTVTTFHNGCTYQGSMPASPAYTNTGTVTVPGASAAAQSSYCNPVHYPYFGENGYLGIEDWVNGDYDYNDFGMYIRMEEEITYACNNNVCGPYLTRVIVTTNAVIFDSGMRHLIHLRRPFNGTYTYTVTRTIPADPNPLVLFDGTSGKETPSGTYTGSGDLNVTLYNTAKYTWPQKNINEPVTIDITLDNPLLNPRVTGTIERHYTAGSASFTDLDPIMSNYDFWVEGTQFKSRWHLADTRSIASTVWESFGAYRKEIPAGTVVPFIIIVPYTNWIPPFEASTITGPYGSFVDFYTTGIPGDWFIPDRVTNSCVVHGGLSFGPYPGQTGTCGVVPPANQPLRLYIPVVNH